MAPIPRHDLLDRGHKICTLLVASQLQELFLLEGDIYLIKDLKHISKIRESEALLSYTHPKAIDLAANPQEIFPKEIELVSNDWTETKNEIIFKSRQGIIFLFTDPFNIPPKVTVTDPGHKISDLICTNTDYKTKEVLHLNGEFFLRGEKGAARIKSSDALQYYLSIKSSKLVSSPEKYFELQKLESVEKEGIINSIYLHGNGQRFKYMAREGGKIEVKKINTPKKKIGFRP